MFHPGKRTSLGLALGSLVVAGLARSDDPRPIPDVIPSARSSREILPAPASAPSNGSISPTASVTLDWSGPSSVRVNKPNDFLLTVRNAADTSAQRVIVQVRVPDGVTATDTAPAAKEENRVLVWDLGTLAGKDSRDLRLKLAAAEKRDLTCQAWVTVTGTAGIAIAVREPKFVATLTAPKDVVLGDPISLKYTVKNVGDATADVPTATVGLKADGATDVQMQSLGRAIEAGQSANGDVVYVGSRGGPLTYTLTAEAEGGLKATASATVNVLVPKLTVAVAGPAERQVGRKATYSVTVMNPGDVALSDVTVNETFPPAFRHVSSSCANTAETGTVTWKVGALAPGEKKVYTYDALAVCPGPATHLVTAVGSRNTKAEASAKTVVEGIPAMRMEVVDLVDPVEKGGETTYEIRLTNTGTKADSQLRLECSLPPELEFVSATGPTGHAERKGIDFGGGKPVKVNAVTFEPVAELAPKAETVFRVKVKAVAAGDVRFKVALTSTHLTTPVTKEESTRVYGD